MSAADTTPCVHVYKHQGTVWKNGQQLPGSGARDRVYYDRYYCTSCLSTRDMNPRVLGNTYSVPLAGTVPA